MSLSRDQSACRRRLQPLLERSFCNSSIFFPLNASTSQLATSVFEGSRRTELDFRLLGSIFDEINCPMILILKLLVKDRSIGNCSEEGGGLVNYNYGVYQMFRGVTGAIPAGSPFRSLKYIAIGASLVGLVSIAGVVYYYPELRTTPVAILQASKRLWNVTHAGLKIAWIYKTSTEASPIKHDKASIILRDAFYKNGGLWIKFGQIIGALDTLVPREYQVNLQTLNTECPRDTITKVRQVIKEDTGKTIPELFLEFDQTPIASASIAQVHKAKLLNGQSVAVKVQHQGLDKSTRFDVEVLKGCITLGEYLFEDFNYRWLIQEIQKNIPPELDFRQQASNLYKCKEMFRKMPNVVIPNIYGEPTKRLLVMEYMNGTLLSNINRIQAEGIDKGKLSKLISKAFIKMIFVEGFVHADPHSGNLLARKKAGTKDQPEIILLDHGLYQKLDHQILKAYCQLWLGILTNDEPSMIDAAAKLGTKHPRVFCSMITAKRPEELKSNSLKKLIASKGQQQDIRKLAVDYRQEIVQVLNEVNRELLLVFKVNDFAKSLQNSLSGRDTDYYLQVAKGCFQTLGTAWWKRWMFYGGYYVHQLFD